MPPLPPQHTQEERVAQDKGLGGGVLIYMQRSEGPAADSEAVCSSHQGPLLCTQVVSWAPSFLGQGLRSRAADSVGMHVLNFYMCCQVAFRNVPLDTITSTVKRAFSAPWLGPCWLGAPSPGPSAASRDLAQSLKGAPALAPRPHHSPHSPGAETCQSTILLLPGTSSPWSRPRHLSLGSPGGLGCVFLLPLARGRHGRVLSTMTEKQDLRVVGRLG